MSLRVAALLVVMAISGTGAAQADEQDQRRITQITDDRIPESSALVASTEHPGLVYTINDSGNEPVVFTIELATGDVVGTAALAGSEPADTEALAIGGDGRLQVADIGDNTRSREEVALYAIDQPGRGVTEVEATEYTVGFTDGSHDAETLLSDPASGRMSIVTKGFLSGGVYQLPAVLSEDRVNVARRIDGIDLPGQVTDGAVLPDGSGVVLRSYLRAFVYRLPEWDQVASIALPPQRQGESVLVQPAERRLLIGSEGSPSPIIAVPLSSQVWDRLHPDPASLSSDPLSAQAGSTRVLPWLVGGGLVPIALLGYARHAKRRDPTV